MLSQQASHDLAHPAVQLSHTSLLPNPEAGTGFLRFNAQFLGLHEVYITP